jgi:hypothetical protein
MTRIMRYILQHDSGMAPCVDDGWVSLATCKPRIRGSAKVGDWVIGFRPRPEDRGLVVWAGCVSQIMEVGDYELRNRGRSDAVYRARRDGGFTRLRPNYHREEDQIRKDLSAPVLVFDRKHTWYFGNEPRMLPDSLLHLAAAGIGHRVNGVKEGDEAALLLWLRGASPPGVHGTPRDKPPSPSSPPPPCGGRKARKRGC